MEKFGRNDLECLVVHLEEPRRAECVATLLDVNLSKFAKHVVIDLARGRKLYLHKSQTANQS